MKENHINSYSVEKLKTYYEEKKFATVFKRELENDIPETEPRQATQMDDLSGNNSGQIHESNFRRTGFKNADNLEFKKLQGTTDQSREFELLITANLSLDLTLDNNIKNYSLSANDAKYHPISDIVAKVEKNDGTGETYAIQLKYTNNKKLLSTNSLFPHGKNNDGQSQKGNFNILKYLTAFQHSKALRSSTLILATNRSFDVTNEIILEDGSDTFNLKITECPPRLEALSFRNASGEGCKCYKFEIVDDNGCQDREKIEMYQDFFQQFVLQTDLMSVQQLEIHVRSIIKNQFSARDGIYEKYIEFVKQWSLRKNKINKTFVKISISLILFEPFVKTLQLLKNRSNQLNDKCKLIKTLIMQFKITVFREDNIEKIRKLWQSAAELADINTLHRETQKYKLIRVSVQNVNSFNDREFSYVMWFFKKAPLVVEDHEDVRKAIDLCSNENLHFIIIENNLVVENNTNTFRNLESLKESHTESYEKILKSFHCTIQGKNFFLGELMQRFNTDLSNIFTPDELICCADDSLELGKTNVTLPSVYIKRKLSKVIIDFNFLNYIDERFYVLISNYKDSHEDGSFLEGFPVIGLNIYLKTPIKTPIIKQILAKPKKVFVTEEECSQTTFDNFCSQVSDNKYFHFRLDSSYELELVRIKNYEAKELKEYESKGHYINELNLFEHESKINIICGEPGIGKTSLVKSITRNPSDHWTIAIFVKDHLLHFRNNEESDEEKFKKYILDQSKTSKFESTLLNFCMENKFVRFIWDGLDELSDDNFNIVLNIIDKLLSKGYKQWLTSRFSLREQLEDRFNVVARTIEKFEKHEQKSYIKERLKNHSAHNILSVLLIIQENDFLEVPLQIFMLTDLLLQDSSKYKYLLNKIFTIPKLYEYFIDIKFDLYHKKLNYDPNNAAHEKKLRQDKLDRIEHYERVAALVLFEQLLSELEVSHAKMFLRKIQNGQDDYGIITSVSDRTEPEFFHNSVLEYFAISYIVKKNIFHPTARKYIFDNPNLKSFYDMIVSNKSKAHRALLLRNYEFLKTCSDEELQQKDQAGRSLLHVACQYGTKYPFLHTEKKDDLYIVDDRTVYWQELKDENPELIKTVELLLTKCNPRLHDKFGMNCFKTALENNCFQIFLTLLNKYKESFSDIGNYLGTILYYAVRFNFSNVFGKYEVIPSFKSKHFEKSLLYLAVYYNSVESLNNILLKVNNKFYREIVNTYQEPLYEEAVEKKNKNIVAVLVDHGVKMKSDYPKSNRTPQKRMLRNGALPYTSNSPLRYGTIHRRSDFFV